MKYAVTEIFHSLQGEGHFVGYPTTFVRMAGCSVAKCHIRSECDEAPWKVKESLDVGQIVARIGSPRIVCLTGGEPTDQEILPLIAALQDAGHRVHLETSGVRSVEGWPLDWLTVSPKVLAGGALKQRMGHALKIVVRPEWSPIEAWDIVTSIHADTNFFHRYLQPMSGPDGAPINLPQVISMLTDETSHNANGQWALSVQAHRFWSVK